MGCCSGKEFTTVEDWEKKMIECEGKQLELAGVDMSTVERKYTTIQMDGAPFNVRTFYIGTNDGSKQTLVMTHGNMAWFASYGRLIALLAKKYRVVGFDSMNLGLNTRSTSKACHESVDTCEKWIQDFIIQTLDAMDLPEKFLLTAHSWGGYLAMMYASVRPNRLQGLYLMSPAGVESYDAATYNKYGYLSQNGGKMDGFLNDKGSADMLTEAFDQKKHPFFKIHELGACLQGLIYSAVAKGSLPALARGGYTNKEYQKYFLRYQKMMLQRTGEGDITMCIPHKLMGVVIHSMLEKDRMDQPEINFPVAMGFGDRDCFASSRGGEDILNVCKNNGSRINLFKFQKGTHAFCIEYPEQTAESIIGHFEGTIADKWEPTIFGDYQWHGEKVTKGWLPYDEQVKNFKK